MAEKVVISNRKEVDVLKQHVLDHNPGVVETSMGPHRLQKLSQQLTSVQQISKPTVPLQQVHQPSQGQSLQQVNCRFVSCLCF